MLQLWTNYPKDEFYEPRFVLFGVWHSRVCVLFFVCEVGLGIFPLRRAIRDDRDMVDLGRMRNDDAG
jgi:hypothetical protein